MLNFSVTIFAATKQVFSTFPNWDKYRRPSSKEDEVVTVINKLMNNTLKLLVQETSLNLHFAYNFKNKGCSKWKKYISTTSINRIFIMDKKMSKE